MLTFEEYVAELRQLACDYATERPELLDDFQHFLERFLNEFYMADGHQEYIWEGWLIAKVRSYK